MYGVRRSQIGIETASDTHTSDRRMICPSRCARPLLHVPPQPRPANNHRPITRSIANQPEWRLTTRDSRLKFRIMTGRVVRILLGVLLIPLLTGIGLAPCTAMAQSASISGTAAPAEPSTSQHRSRHADNGPTKAPTGQHNHAPCDSSTGMNCCPAVTGCSVIALPSTVVAPQPATALVASVHANYDELPIAMAVAPEPPPPKA